MPAGSPVRVATRHSPWDSPAVSKRNIQLNFYRDRKAGVCATPWYCRNHWRMKKRILGQIPPPYDNCNQCSSQDYAGLSIGHSAVTPQPQNGTVSLGGGERRNLRWFHLLTYYL